jgi:hypothetical protein
MTTPAGYDYAVFHRSIHEYVLEDMRLGRHVKHDSRNRNYPYRATGQPLHSNLVQRNIPILNQLQVGSCTGNAETGALGCGALYTALMASRAFANLTLDEQFALSLYSAAETIDGDGPYPPNDNGSTGPSVAQAAKNGGYISSYIHCFSLNDVLDALSNGQTPIIGANWYDSMDSPDGNGLVTISPNAVVRGGHEWLSRGIDVDKKLVLADNSWGEQYGNKGSFDIGFGDLERLLAEQGDGTISVPLAA